jgi:SAM-dependent methyltransferase
MRWQTGPSAVGLGSGETDMDPVVAVARAFDRLAPRYEELVESNPIHASLRAKSIAWLEEAFEPGMRLLEIGCGAGHEAVHLGRLGVHVFATDISSKMVEAARARVHHEGLERFVRVEQCAAGNLAQLPMAEPYDGAFGSFGALNCEPDLGHAIAQVARCVRTEGDVLLSVVSRPSLPETVLGSARLRLRQAFRRMGGELAVDLYGLGPVHARAYSEGELRRALTPFFRIERLEGWLVALPPPYAAEAWDRVRPIHAPLRAMDARLARVWPFRGWGDHLHVWARRTPS